MQPLIAIPAIAALVYRAYSRQSLTPLGIFTAFLTAIIHALHPWSVFFALLTTFFLAGTAATKVKHAQKVKLTVSASGGNAPSVPHPRTAIQVLANSATASLLILVHWQYRARGTTGLVCLKMPGAHAMSWVDLLPYGVFAQYAAVAADTLASELGILSTEQPILITDIAGLLSFKPKRVPRGTNGGVTLLGTAAGAGGAALIAIVAASLTPYCSGQWSFSSGLLLVLGLTVWGALGNLLDSILGGLLQASVVDERTGRVIEGEGGLKVQYSKKSDKEGQRRVLNGNDILDNNGVNFLMAAMMSLGGIVVLSSSRLAMGFD
jgi:uncharacterized protein (TIGR00297 family)